ncbi:MAG: hypothetical protein K0Q49_1720 [Haloplasmataceae bacterium]|nr:hypothetical protein [Haloplasmataceae bacterium]
MKAFNKLVTRKITKNKSRYFSILLIILLGVAFYSGIKATSPNMQIAANNYFNNQNFMDIEIISPTGFSEDDLKTIKLIPEVNDISLAYSTEVYVNLNNTKLIIKLLSLSSYINKPSLIKGHLPQNNQECVVDPQFLKQSDFNIGDTVTFSSDITLNTILVTNVCTIVGIINLPQYISLDRGVSHSLGGEINSYILLNDDAFVLPKYTHAYLTINHPSNFSRFSDEYDHLLKTATEKLKHPSWVVLDINSNAGFLGYKSDAERIAAIGNVFPIVFFLVATLVSLTSMTRLVENDRTEIGTLISLGYNRKSIIKGYLTYAISASLLGSVFGVILGFLIFPRVIFSSYSMLYTLPPLVVTLIPKHVLFATMIAVLLVSVTTYFVCSKLFKTTPAILMRPKSPTAGKRIFLERISFIWKRLNFNQKITYRNLIRYKKRFFMTIFGIMGCTALLLTGFGLKDSIGDISHKQFDEIRPYDMELTLKDHLTQTELAPIHQTLIDYEINQIFYANQTPLEVEDHFIRNIYLFVPDTQENMDEFIHLRMRSNHREINLNDDEVIITEKLASLLDVGIDSQLTIVTNNQQRLTVKIGGIVENYIYHYVYMSKPLYEQLTQQNFSPNVILGKTSIDEASLSPNLLKQPVVKSVRFVSSIKTYFVDMIEALDIVVLILIISAELLALIVLFSLTNINIDERKRELATIKVLGFYDIEVSSYIYRENMILTFIGSILGLIFGYFLVQYVLVTAEVDMLMFSREIKPQSFINSVLLTCIFAFFVNFIMHFRLKHINMIESLKNVE